MRFRFKLPRCNRAQSVVGKTADAQTEFLKEGGRQISDEILRPWAEQQVAVAERFQTALERIAEMAEASDAHPDLQFGPIAREALDVPQEMLDGYYGAKQEFPIAQACPECGKGIEIQRESGIVWVQSRSVHESGANPLGPAFWEDQKRGMETQGHPFSCGPGCRECASSKQDGDGIQVGKGGGGKTPPSGPSGPVRGSIPRPALSSVDAGDDAWDGRCACGQVLMGEGVVGALHVGVYHRVNEDYCVRASDGHPVRHFEDRSAASPGADLLELGNALYRTAYGYQQLASDSEADPVEVGKQLLRLGGAMKAWAAASNHLRYPEHHPAPVSASSEAPDDPAGEPAARHKGPQGSVERGGGVTRDSEGDRLSPVSTEAERKYEKALKVIARTTRDPEAKYQAHKALGCDHYWLPEGTAPTYDRCQNCGKVKSLGASDDGTRS